VKTLNLSPISPASTRELILDYLEGVLTFPDGLVSESESKENRTELSQVFEHVELLWVEISHFFVYFSLFRKI
jgi:hypothetical protein